MNLIERYVRDVGRRLPKRQRADVEAELSSSLQDTLEDRILGTPTEDDVVELLKEFGSPEQIAASYQPSRQYLIGPELYPFFRIVMGAVLLAITIGLVVANVVALLFTPDETIEIGQRLLNGLGGYFQALLSAFASVVIIFAILQRLEVRPGEDEADWDPRDLPDVKDVDVVGRAETVAGIAFTAVFLVLLNIFNDRIGIIITFGQAPVLTEIVQANLIWLNVALLLGLALNLLLLWQGRWHLYARLAKLAIDLLWLYIIYRVVTMLAAREEIMATLGFPEPLPAMFVRLGYGILALVAILILVDTAKWIYQSLRQNDSGSRMKAKPGSDSIV